MVCANYLGIDIGGTSIKYGIVDNTGTVLFDSSTPTQVELGVEVFQKKLQEIIKETRSYRPQAIGVSVAGIVDIKENKVDSGAVNLTFLHDFDLARWLEAESSLAVRLINDVRAAALGELWTGAAKELDTFFCTTIGTGLGGCLIINEKVHSGIHNRAGEIGFMPSCSQSLTMEDQVSAKALHDLAESTLGYQSSGLVDFFNQVREGNKKYHEVLTHWVQPLCKLLSDILIIIDPQAIIIGGGIAESGDVLLNEINKGLKNFLPKVFYKESSILLAENGNLAGVIGAVKNLETFTDLSIVH